MFTALSSRCAATVLSACILFQLSTKAASPSAALDSTFAVGSGAGFPSDGSSWPQVTALAVQTDGKVVAGGQAYFTNFNGTPINYICRINTNGTLDPAFQTNVGSGPAGAGLTISKIITQPDGKILVGGTFSTFNGFSRSAIARLNVDGSVDSSFLNTGSGAGGTFAPNVAAIALQADGKIIIGGYFYTFNGTTVPAVARLNTNGTVDSSFTLPTIQGFSVGAVGVESDGKVFVGGTFTNWNGFTTPGIVRLNTNGATDSVFAPTHQIPFPSINALYAPGDGSVFVGGSIQGTTTNITRFFAHLTSTGAIDATYPTPDGSVTDIQPWPYGGILVGGRFRNVGAQPRGDVCYFDGSGNLDSTFAPQPYAIITNDIVHIYAMGVAPDGKIVVGGWFTNFPNNTQLNGQNYSGIGRLVGSPILTYSNWVASFGLTSANSGAGQDPDDDGVPNVFEFYSGSTPTNQASLSRPVLTFVQVTGQMYPAISFTHNKITVGATVTAQVSSNVKFTNSLGSTLFSTTDLGNGIEQVVIRSNSSVSTSPIQFLQVLLQFNP